MKAKAPSDNDYSRIARLARMGCKRRTLKHLRLIWRLQRAVRPIGPSTPQEAPHSLMHE